MSQKVSSPPPDEGRRAQHTIYLPLQRGDYVRIRNQAIREQVSISELIRRLLAPALADLPES